MYLDPNKTQLDNMYDLVSDTMGLNVTASDVTIGTASAVTPSGSNGNHNSTVLLQSVAGGRFNNLGNLTVYYNRRNINDFIGRPGSSIYVDDSDDTLDKIALKICNRLKIPFNEVTYTSSSLGRIPSGQGAENIVFTFSAVGGSSNRLFVNGSSPVITAINKGPLKLPLQPSLFGTQITSATIGGFQYPTYDGTVVYSTQFNNMVHGDSARTPEASFIYWLNNFIPIAFRQYVKFTPENTELFGVVSTTISATSQTFGIRAKVGATDSPVPVSGIALKCNIRNFAGITNWTSVPSWVIANTGPILFKKLLSQYWCLPTTSQTSYFSFTSITRNTTTGAITATGNSLVAGNPMAPITGTFSLTLSP